MNKQQLVEAISGYADDTPIIVAVCNESPSTTGGRPTFSIAFAAPVEAIGKVRSGMILCINTRRAGITSELRLSPAIQKTLAGGE
jgi:hypothetical protein